MKKVIWITICLAFVSGCSVPVQKYSPEYKHVKILKKIGKKIALDDFKAKELSLGEISVRGSGLSSPYGKDMIHYLQIALQSELEKARVYDESSSKKISAIIKENDIDASGFSEGIGYISAIFTVKNNNVMLYNSTISIKHEWQSSMLGMIAIPRAAEAYPVMAKMLLKKLYSDSEFIDALKK